MNIKEKKIKLFDVSAQLDERFGKEGTTSRIEIGRAHV